MHTVAFNYKRLFVQFSNREYKCQNCPLLRVLCSFFYYTLKNEVIFNPRLIQNGALCHTSVGSHSFNTKPAFLVSGITYHFTRKAAFLFIQPFHLSGSTCIRHVMFFFFYTGGSEPTSFKALPPQTVVDF